MPVTVSSAAEHIEMLQLGFPASDLDREAVHMLLVLCSYTYYTMDFSLVSDEHYTDLVTEAKRLPRRPAMVTLPSAHPTLTVFCKVLGYRLGLIQLKRPN